MSSTVPQTPSAAQEQIGAVVSSVIRTWDEVFAPSCKPLDPITAVPELPARKAFRIAVADVATQLQAQYPRLTARISRAVQIVLVGDVEPAGEGKYRVGSQTDADVQYVVDGACHCKDSDRPELEGRCKHVLATEIFTTAYQQAAQTLAQPDAALTTTNPNPTFEEVVAEGLRMEEERERRAAAEAKTVRPLLQTLELRGAVMTEAPYSVNVKVSQGGYCFQLTIRKQERTELLDAMNGLPEWLDTHGYQPAEPGRRAEREPDETPAATEAPNCRYHGTQNMKPSKFGQGKWICSMKLSDGSWCNQPWPAKAKA